MKTLICLSALFFTMNSFAQVLQPEVLTSGSMSMPLQSGYLTWNVGDWMTETYVGEITIEQGFLHAFDIRPEVTTNIKYESRPSVSVWPNPTKSYFQIQMDDDLADEVLLVDNHGQVISIWKVTEQLQRFDISRFPSGQYYVLLRSQNSIHSSAIITITL